MHIVMVVVMLLFPLSVFGKTIYFQADAETGNLSQWTTGGGNVSSNKVSASKEVVHSGSWAFKHNLPEPAVLNHAKVARWAINGKVGVEEAYYSAWYYIKQGFVDKKFKNIFQWKPAGVGSGGITFSIHALVFNQGVRELVLKHSACILGEVPCIDFSQYIRTGEGYRQKKPIPVPTNTWFHIEAYYKASATNGHVIVWQNGVEIFNLSHPNLNTLHSKSKDHKYVYWGIGNYVDAKSTGVPHLLYTDDAMVTDYQVYPLSQQYTSVPSPKNLRIK